MRYKINLLQEKEASLFDRVMYFFLNYLRYIIVITQLVVIGVFFYRFQVDQSIVDLKESVDQKVEIIKTVMPIVKQAEEIDSRTKEIKKILALQQINSSMMSYFLSVFPQDIYLNNLNIKGNSISFNGTTLDSRILQLFYSALKKDNKFVAVDLQNIKKTETGYSFNMNLNTFKNN